LSGEALNVFKSWNSNWTPLYFIVDFSEVEIQAITEVFKCLIYICDFHRVQAWNRWFKKRANIVSKEDAVVLLTFFKKLANSKTEEEYCIIEKDMHTSDVWKRNKKAQAYYLGTWYPVREKWTRAFFDDNFFFIINTNNGIESLHNVLKNSYLKQHVDKSICGVLDVIINEFLDEAFNKYKVDNSCLDSKYKCYNSEIPHFLHDRPNFFIRHVYERLATARNIYSRDGIIVLNGSENTMFVIKSETDTNSSYTVNFSTPSCTCYDFLKFRFPCKHLCAIILYVPNFSFNDLPCDYLNSPYLNIDPKYSVFRNEF